MLLMTLPQVNTAEALDATLLQVASGNRQALTELYEAARVPVYAAALSLLKSPEDAQDVTQDTFVRIWEQAASYRPRGSAMAWILTIARNLARMKLRSRRRTVELTEPEWAALPAPAGADADDLMALQAALNILKPHEREVVLLHAVSGLKHKEIAAVLKRPLPTILSQYNRALKKLSAHLEGDDAP